MEDSTLITESDRMASAGIRTSAQVDQLLGGKPPCLVVICPPTDEETAYIVSPTDLLKLSDSEWQPLPLVSRLGIDLLYAKPDNSEHPLFIVGGGVNATLAALTLDCDPISASFGASIRPSAMDGVAFRYADERQKLTKAVLKPVELFITERMTAIKNALAGPEGISGATNEYEKLGPKAFKMAFKKYRAEQVSLYPTMGWAKVECPVTLTETSCEACGQVEDALGEGSVLMRCGRCRRAFYCDRTCQSEDWRAHKPFCSS